MKTQNLLLLILSILLTSNAAFASVPSKANEKAKLLEELTGKKAVGVASPAVAVQPAIAVASMAVSRKHLNAGFQAYTKKDYITALKHYNTIVVKHAKSPEVKSAYLAKAKLYQEMGLIEQAQYNVKLAQELEKKSK
jgi:hypothetical protein